MFPVAQVLEHNVPGKWSNHKLFLYESRTVPHIMDDYRLAREASLFLAKDVLGKYKGNGIKDLYIEEREYIDRAASIVVTGHKINDVNRYEEFRECLSKKLELHYQFKKDYLQSQVTLINYIMDGKWKYSRELPGDEVFIASFGESEDFPLLWFAFSVRRGRYFRLHGWAKSILGYYLETCLKEEPSQRPGLFPFSWLMDTFKPKLIYLEPLAHTLAFLNRIQTPEEKKINTLKKADKSCSLGEPKVLYATKTMAQAYKNPALSIESCIRCGANHAGFFIRQLGNGIRFCGKC